MSTVHNEVQQVFSYRKKIDISLSNLHTRTEIQLGPKPERSKLLSPRELHRNHVLHTVSELGTTPDTDVKEQQSQHLVADGPSPHQQVTVLHLQLIL